MESFQEQKEDYMSRAIITDPVLVGYGAISAGQMSMEQAQEFVEIVMSNHLVVVSPNAASCCIDGRCGNCRLDGSAVEPGPKVAGGALITAYAAAELTGWFSDNDTKDIPIRMQMVADHLAAGGIVVGAHCDTAARTVEFDGKSGCGANDKLPEIIGNMRKEMIQQLIMGGAGLFFEGDTYNPDRTEAVVAQAVRQPVDPTQWLATYMIDVLGGATSPRIEELQGQPDKTGGHYEGIVFLNPNENTTVDRDRLPMQAFVIDTWYIDKLAAAMTRGADPAQAEQLKHAMVAYQIATLATLGDGSHRIAKLPIAEPVTA